MVHLFRRERPSQWRGVSQLAPCINLFAKLRRFTEAVIDTAENFAAVGGTIETAFTPDLCDHSEDSKTIPFLNGQLMTLPDGWRYNPYKPEQPTTTYAEFKKEILHEVISSLLIPWNLASGDSSDFNFASGQLDHRIFARYVDFQRRRLETRLINRFFDFWVDFATFVDGIIPPGLGPFEHRWYWPGREPIDPSKAASAATTAKMSGLLDESAYWQAQGISAYDAIDQQLRLEKYRQEQRAELNIEPPPTNGTNEETPATDQANPGSQQ